MLQEDIEKLELALTQGVVKIKFEKKDGSLREMNATLKPTLVVEYEKKTVKTKEKKKDVMPVFDVDKNEWRSFRLDSVKEVHYK